MAIGDYTKTLWVNNSAPAINATNLANIENKLYEIDIALQAVGLGVNLNAGLLDGYNSSTTQGNSVIPVTNATGFLPVNGIAFPATAVASSDANTLDDYEEGSWTPTIIGSTTAGTQTYSIAVGRYRKIGNSVFILGVIVITAKDVAMAGNIRIGGIPFAPQAVTNLSSSFSVGPFIGFTFPANYTYMSIINGTSTSVLVPQRHGSGVAASEIAVSEIANATTLYFSGFYFTT